MKKSQVNVVSNDVVWNDRDFKWSGLYWI